MMMTAAAERISDRPVEPKGIRNGLPSSRDLEYPGDDQRKQYELLSTSSSSRTPFG